MTERDIEERAGTHLHTAAVEQVAKDVVRLDRGSRSISRSIEAVSGEPGAVHLTLCAKKADMDLEGCTNRRNGLTVFRCRNLFEDHAKLKRGLLAECPFKAALRCRPARTGFAHDSLPGFRQRDHTAASILC